MVRAHPDIRAPRRRTILRDGGVRAPGGPPGLQNRCGDASSRAGSIPVHLRETRGRDNIDYFAAIGLGRENLCLAHCVHATDAEIDRIQRVSASVGEIGQDVADALADWDIGLAERLQLGWVPDREPDMKFETSWVQEKDNQLALLDTFFGAVTPEESLCFFYAKRTPLSEQSRRVIVGGLDDHMANVADASAADRLQVHLSTLKLAAERSE